MKFLVLIIVVLVVLWIVRSAGRAERRASAREKQRAATPPAPQDMVECPVCRVHLPRADALPGPGGQLYCCADHRQRAGG